MCKKSGKDFTSQLVLLVLGCNRLCVLIFIANLLCLVTVTWIGTKFLQIVTQKNCVKYQTFITQQFHCEELSQKLMSQLVNSFK